MITSYRDLPATGIAAVLVVLLAPLALLGPSLLGPRTYVPYDMARFPPVATLLDDAELEAVSAASNTDPTEVPATFVPELRFARQELEQGRLPHWNPYARFGAPLLATSVVGLLYPPNWLVLAHADPQDGLALGAYLSFVIAGLLMLGLLRAAGRSWTAAVAGALLFQLSGTLTANAHFYQRLAALIWLPGMLWAGLRIVQRRGRARALPAAGLAVCVAMTWLAGFPAYGSAALLAAGVFVAVLLAGAWRDGGPRAARAPALWSLGSVGLGFALAAVQLAPMFAFFPESSRVVDPSLDELAQQSFDPMGWLGLLAPELFGHPLRTAELPYGQSPLAFWLCTRQSWQDGHALWPQYNFIEYTVFIGTPGLLLAALGALVPRERATRAALAAFAVLAVLATGSALLWWLHALPGMRNVHPLRCVGPLAALLAILAAAGVDRVRATAAPRRHALLGIAAAGGALAAAGVWLAVRGLDGAGLLDALTPGLLERYAHGPASDLTAEAVRGYLGGPDLRYANTAAELLRGQSLRVASLLGLTAVWWLAMLHGRARRGRVDVLLRAGLLVAVVELVGVGAPINRGRELTVPLETPVHAFLRAARDAAAPHGGYTVARAAKLAQLPLAFPPCLLVPERIRDLHAYTFLDRHSHRPLVELYGIDHMMRQQVWPLAFPDDARLDLPYFDLIGIRWVFATEALEHAGTPVGPQLVGTRELPDGTRPRFLVHERPNALPRAFVVPELVEHTDDDAVIAALVDPALEPRAAVHVAAADAAGLPAVPVDAAAAARRVEFTADTPLRVELTVGDGPAGWLVLGDAWFSGWRATAGGRPLPMVRGNLSMRVVPIDTGSQRVVFEYTPPRLAAGAAVTALAGLALLALLAAGIAAHRHR